MRESARGRPKPKAKAKAKPMIDSATAAEKRGISREIVPTHHKAREEGNRQKARTTEVKPRWAQPNNGIKSLCALVEKPRVRQDLEGFTKPSKTVRPRAVESCVSVNCETKFFPAKFEKPKETETKTEEKDLGNFESFPK